MFQTPYLGVLCTAASDSAAIAMQRRTKCCRLSAAFYRYEPPTANHEQPCLLQIFRKQEFAADSYDIMIITLFVPALALRNDQNAGNIF